jgi:hypothetical protein
MHKYITKIYNKGGFWGEHVSGQSTMVSRLVGGSADSDTLLFDRDRCLGLGE